MSICLSYLATVAHDHSADADRHDIDIQLKFKATDPYAMTINFPTVQPATRWTFARDLLLEALETSAPEGNGDVCIYAAPGSEEVVFHLMSPDGEVYVRVLVNDCHEFAAATELVVPPGTEAIDVDGAIELILATADGAA